jgi:hypothetical protein
MEIIIFPLFYGFLLLVFLAVVYAVTATIRRAWYPEEYEPRPPLMGWRGCLLLVLGLLVAVVVLAVLFSPV